MSSLAEAPLALFVLQAISIVGLSRLLGSVARAIGQPMVVAEIAVGVALGPSLFGWLAPGAFAAVFPPSSLAPLGLLSQVGLLLFMFLIGLEFDPQLLKGRGRASIAISHASIAAPFGLGTLLALYLYPRVAPAHVSFLPFALFLGAAMSITAFPVLARILVERGLLDSRVGMLTLACAAVDDVTAWCILAFVVAVVRESGTSAFWTCALALAYIGFMCVVIRPLLMRLARYGEAKGHGATDNYLAVILLLALLSAWITERIGIHALFGAFLLGAVAPRTDGFAKRVAGKLETVVVVLLLPLFFAFSGLRTDLQLLNSPESWWMCGLIVFVACLGKFGGSSVAARLSGLSWREASTLGILMNTRGLMELIVLNTGLELGVISPKLFTMMVIMAIITTFMTTPLVLKLYPRRLAKPAEDVASFTLLESPVREPSP
ncbi:MAG TPA: cation:proton antiporter [Polyangiaceae bacterium]|nr:cation:proton antiporter [Polyangiaceae bacterium]